MLSKREKEILWGVVAIVVLIALVIFFSSARDDQTTDTLDDPDQPAETERVFKSDPAELLASFPEGFPIETGAQSSSGYKYIPANSADEQSTVEYSSRQSFSQNTAIFENFLSENGFNIVNQTSEESFAFYYATKDGNDISITVEEIDSRVNVSASYLER